MTDIETTIHNLKEQWAQAIADLESDYHRGYMTESDWAQQGYSMDKYYRYEIERLIEEMSRIAELCISLPKSQVYHIFNKASSAWLFTLCGHNGYVGETQPSLDASVLERQGKRPCKKCKRIREADDGSK